MILADLSPIIFSYSAVFVYKSKAKHGVLFVVYPVFYVGVESLVFRNNDDASAIFLPARQSRVKLLRRSFSIAIFTLIIYHWFSVVSYSFPFFYDYRIIICFLKSVFCSSRQSRIFIINLLLLRKSCFITERCLKLKWRKTDGQK